MIRKDSLGTRRGPLCHNYLGCLPPPAHHRVPGDRARSLQLSDRKARGVCCSPRAEMGRETRSRLSPGLDVPWGEGDLGGRRRGIFPANEMQRAPFTFPRFGPIMQALTELFGRVQAAARGWRGGPAMPGCPAPCPPRPRSSPGAGSRRRGALLCDRAIRNFAIHHSILPSQTVTARAAEIPLKNEKAVVNC